MPASVMWVCHCRIRPSLGPQGGPQGAHQLPTGLPAGYAGLQQQQPPPNMAGLNRFNTPPAAPQVVCLHHLCHLL
jgi:hypothetical protein